MKKVSAHHVLPPPIQEEYDRKAIQGVIDTYSIEDAVLILYTALLEMRTQNYNIDTCIIKVDNELQESKKFNIDD